ncbi:galacturan 1,4-alpha-galacturonidase B [Xylariales sp. PMI_506]|nr:galacturan 1,4-alpha-galacturonidase B [Xylariales sp. PMI_506]
MALTRFWYNFLATSWILVSVVVGVVAQDPSSLSNAPGAQLKRHVCTVPASGTNATDDAPAIVKAFTDCGHHGKVVFENTTYYVNSVMNISWLHDVEIDLYGTLVWSTNISYWLNHSLPVGYQNQSTAFILGGNGVVFDGHGVGTFDGNGAVWYKYASGISNLARRPHAITFANLTNARVTGLNFLRSQMWTMSIIHTHDSSFENIFINNTSLEGTTGGNTDGMDTIYSSHLTFKGWTVQNGDDSMSFKANSTDITVSNCTFINGLGIAMGSIGQYKDQFETIERIRGGNLRYKNTLHAVYFKTWTGEQVGYPPNGGGGGLGFASDLEFSDLYGTSFRGAPFTISQCTTFSGTAGNCTSSKFEIEDISLSNFTGTASALTLASFQCSAVKPCHDLTIENATLTQASTGASSPVAYLCDNVEDPVGWNCTGSSCVGSSATGQC